MTMRNDTADTNKETMTEATTLCEDEHRQAVIVTTNDGDW